MNSEQHAAEAMTRAQGDEMDQQIALVHAQLAVAAAIRETGADVIAEIRSRS